MMMVHNVKGAHQHLFVLDGLVLLLLLSLPPFQQAAASCTAHPEHICLNVQQTNKLDKHL